MTLFGPSPEQVRIWDERWFDENGIEYVAFDFRWKGTTVAFTLGSVGPDNSGLPACDHHTEAEWAEYGIRSAVAWAKIRAAEAKAKADREEAARAQAEAQAVAFKLALVDLTALVETVRAELRETRADLQAELEAARADIVSLKKRL